MIWLLNSVCGHEFNSFLRKQPGNLTVFPEVSLHCFYITLPGTPLSSHNLERETGLKIWFFILVTWKLPTLA